MNDDVVDPIHDRCVATADNLRRLLVQARKQADADVDALRSQLDQALASNSRLTLENQSMISGSHRARVLLREALGVSQEASHHLSIADMVEMLLRERDRWRQAYEQKLADFARETARVSRALAACDRRFGAASYNASPVGEAGLGWLAALEYVEKAIRAEPPADSGRASLGEGGGTDAPA